MNPDRKCLSCQRAVPAAMSGDGRRYTRPSTLLALDPDRLFCTVHCAVRYAVDKARKFDMRAAMPDEAS